MNTPGEQKQVALITGAGRIPMPALALSLLDEGIIVAANDLSPTLIDPLEAAAHTRPGRFQAYIADATRGMPLRAMIDEILNDWGRIDILVNNPRIQPKTDLIDMDEWDWQRTVEMNLNGPFLVTQIAARLMREQGGGVILNIVDSDPVVLDAPGHAAYAASQQALLALSQAAARELIAYNIRVYTLCPDQAVLSPGEGPASGNADQGKTGEVFTRFATFLCSQAATSLAGQVFRVSHAQVFPEPGYPWQASSGSDAIVEE